MSQDPGPGAASTRVRYRSLDTLRGLAAWVVALGHFELFRRLNSPHSPYHHAVDFFLLLSGFVLAHGYFFEGNMPLREFAWRRWARLYPLHFITLLLFLVESAALGLPIDPSGVVKHLLFIQNIGFGPRLFELNVPSWTIAVEFWVNLLVYGLILLCGGLRARTIAALLLLAAGCFALVLRISGSLNVAEFDYGGWLNSGLVRCTASFCLGVVLYWLCRSGRLPAVPAAWQWPLFGLFFFSMLVPWPNFRGTDAWIPALYFAVVWTFATAPGGLGAWLAKGGILGDLSFSVYMLHWPIAWLFWYRPTEQAFLAMPFGKTIETTLFCLAVLSLAWCCQRWVEMPLYRWLLRHPPGRGRAKRLSS